MNQQLPQGTITALEEKSNQYGTFYKLCLDHDGQRTWYALFGTLKEGTAVNAVIAFQPGADKQGRPKIEAYDVVRPAAGGPTPAPASAPGASSPPPQQPAPATGGPLVGGHRDMWIAFESLFQHWGDKENPLEVAATCARIAITVNRAFDDACQGNATGASQLLDMLAKAGDGVDPIVKMAADIQSRAQAPENPAAQADDDANAGHPAFDDDVPF